LAGGLAEHAVDHAAASHGGAPGDRVAPAHHVRVFLNLQELARSVQRALHQIAVPGPDRHVGDRVVVAHHVRAIGQVAIQDVELALHLHRVAIDGVLELLGRVGIEVAESAAQERRAAHLPEQP